MKRVCFLLNNEFISDNRVRLEAESLVKAGYDVTLIGVRDKSKIVPKYEEKNGVHIHRIIYKRFSLFNSLSMSHIKNLIRILKSYSSFDFVHAHDANMLLMGWVIAKCHKAKLIYDSHELWSSVFDVEIEKLEREKAASAPKKRVKVLGSIPIYFNKRLNLTVSSMTKVYYQNALNAVKKMAKMERRLLPQCDALISVSSSICDIIHANANKQIPHVVSLRNIPKYHTTLPEKPRLFHEYFNLSSDTRILLYQGVLADVRGVPQMIEVMKTLADENIVLVLMGYATERYLNLLYTQIVNSPKLRRSMFIKDAVYGPDFPKWTASADLGIITTPNKRISYYLSLPNKLFEYIQAGIPTAVCDFPEIANIVNTYGLGFTLDPENTDEITEKIQAYFQDTDRQNQYLINIQQTKKELNWENEEKILINLYRLLEGKTVIEPVITNLMQHCESELAGV